MSKWEKVKEFCSEHKDEIGYAAIAVGTFAYGMTMFAIGVKTSEKRFNAGLAMCVAVKPELKPMLTEAQEQVKKVLFG